ncbi:MAG: DNA-directed RNA polymerase subunit alpha [bacterium]|nr:DNA-directed RNA polymerase subunit alpha [bacterium]
MENVRLSDNIKINIVSETANSGVFEIEGLYSGYGTTIGNALRRVLLSSLPGAAITQVKIKGVGHEFTTIPGIIEDVVELCLNLKKVRFNFNISYADYTGPEMLTLKAKGEGAVTAASIKGTHLVTVLNPDQHIATITEKGTEFEIELMVAKGLGYVPVESMKGETLPVGVIQLDAIFTPVTKVNFAVENMRVGDRTDYNKVRFIIETDGSIAPSAAMRKSASILQDHYAKVYEQLKLLGGEAIAESVTETSAVEAPEKKPKKKRVSKKKE